MHLSMSKPLISQDEMHTGHEGSHDQCRHRNRGRAEAELYGGLTKQIDRLATRQTGGRERARAYSELVLQHKRLVYIKV